MKKNTLMTFCLKAALLLLILFGADRVVGAAFVKFKDMGLERNPENMWLKTSYTVEKVDADVVVIGSSRASHHYVTQMLEDSLGMTAYNCGQDGCFFLYQNCIVNMLLDRYQPKMMIWDIQSSSFTGQGDKEYQNFRYLTPYYTKNKWTQQYIDSESAKMRYRMMSRMFGYNSKIFNYIVPLVSYGLSTQKGYIPLPVSGYNYPEMTIYEVSVEPNYAYLELLKGSLERCKAMGVEMIVCISPSYSVKSADMAKVESAIEETAKRCGAEYVNDSSDTLFLNDPTLFKDASHLNDKGARLHTQRLIDEIRSIY